ncbi:Mce protein [Mycolicibacterium thermoresistibile]
MIVTVTTDKNRDTPERDGVPENAAASENAESPTEPGDTPEDVTAEESTTDSSPADAPTADEPARRRKWPLIAAATTVVVALLALSGYLGWQVWQDRQVDQAADAAQQAAVEYAEILTSIDSAAVDENFAQVLDGATGEFKDMYSQSSTQLRQLLIDNEASARGVVLESAVQSASKDEVVVLLFIDQTVSNTHVPDPRVDRSRVKMTMQHVDGKWRAAEVALP